jgi:crotonobetainyl-CoA:carnitine CoA-transferase CaiB-like acyl-CoA transferase
MSREVVMRTQGAPLEGIRVIEIANFVSAPLAGLMLADFGADVIKIEKVAGGDDGRVMPPLIDGDGYFYIQLDRNKRSVAVDLKDPRGIEIAANLLRTADVVIDNMRPGTLSRLGLDYDSISPDNPGLIACSISGFGLGNAYTSRAAYDPILQAMSGLMMATGFEGDPPVRTGAPVIDYCAALLATIGIMVALQHRSETGRGQVVDVSLLGAAATIMGSHIFQYWASGTLGQRLTRDQGSLTLVPIVATSDDRMVQISFGNYDIFRRTCDAGHRPDLAEDERFSSLSGLMTHPTELREELRKMFGAHDFSFWSAALDEHRIPWGAVNTVDGFFEDPIVKQWLVGTVQRSSGASVPALRTAIRFSGAPLAELSAPATLGQHTTEVLADLLGLDHQRIIQLKGAGVIR